jgi:hypothetical protein
VLLWKDSSGGHQGMINFHERITTTLLGSAKSAKDIWRIKVKLYRDTKNTGAGKFMYTTVFSCNTSKVYCLIDDVIVEAERVENILEKLKNLWIVRQEINYDVC